MQNNNFKYNNNWKEINKKYLFELQKFLDIAENVENEDLKQRIIFQMLKCNKVLTELVDEIINKT